MTAPRRLRPPTMVAMELNHRAHALRCFRTWRLAGDPAFLSYARQWLLLSRLTVPALSAG